MKAALYARYSTDKQSGASIEDQHRVCERLAERHGFKVVARFSDAAISGGTTSRPGYQDLLSAGRRHEYDVIVAEDSSRLWRNLAEQSPRLAELSDLGVHVVTNDLDTRQDSAEILGAVTGAMAQQYRKEIGRRTRRGLEGLARGGKSAGGRAYGYISATDSGTGRREVNPDQAKIVRQIFEWRASGWSPVRIASELNDRAVPSPGSSWKREQRRRASWMVSAVAGDPARGVGILNNEMYRGRVIWNRHRWVRSATDSSKRRCVQNPQSEWIILEESRLRIVSDDLWKAVKHQQRERALAIGERVKEGKARQAAASTGPGPRYLFSTLIACGRCGANYVMTDATHFGCSSRKHGGPAACTNDFRVRQTLLEDGLLEGIRRELLAPEAIEEFRRRVAKRLAEQNRKTASQPQRLAEVEREIANLTDAIASGMLRTSPALATRLSQAEAELAKFHAANASPQLAKVERILPRVVDGYLELVADLPNALKRDPARARASIRQLLGGQIRVEVDEKAARFLTQKGRTEAAFLRASGLNFGPQTTLVAGAGFEPATFGFVADRGA